MTTNESCRGKAGRNNEFVPKTAPVIGCVLVLVGWLVFILAYALDWSPGLDLFQNMIVTVVSIVVAGMLMGGVMLVWYHPNGELWRTAA